MYLCSTQSKWYTFELFFGILLRYHLHAEGVVSLDWEKKEIVAACYGYDDDGRYSVNKAYSLDGKFLRQIGEKERE